MTTAEMKTLAAQILKVAKLQRARIDAGIGAIQETIPLVKSMDTNDMYSVDYRRQQAEAVLVKLKERLAGIVEDCRQMQKDLEAKIYAACFPETPAELRAYYAIRAGQAIAGCTDELQLMKVYANPGVQADPALQLEIQNAVSVTPVGQSDSWKRFIKDLSPHPLRAALGWGEVLEGRLQNLLAQGEDPTRYAEYMTDRGDWSESILVDFDHGLQHWLSEAEGGLIAEGSSVAA